VPAETRRAPPSQGGFFLIEAMVAILIFALGILGLVAMGGTAVSSQSDAQYRTEASGIANAIAGQMALALDRTNPTTKAASLAAFAHLPDSATPCTFTGPPELDSVSAPTVFPLLQRAANAASAPGMPGATAANQQIFVDPATFGRVVITLCWKTASDNAWRRHTLVAYVN
jgi:type IV pilus modification protein PilV